MTLSSVLGQPRAMDALRSALKGGSVHHAYLFAGPEGVGKELAAVSFAQALFCTQKPGEGCGRCSACRRVERRSHPDVTWVMPEEEQVARGVAGRADFLGTPSRDIRVEQIRSLQQRLFFRPLEGSHKLVIVASAQQMNVQAQNAFLKSLEEPPASSILILLASAPDRLLATIRSRCTLVSFGPLPEDLIIEKLRETRKLDQPTAQLVAFLAAGSLGRALALDVEQLAHRKELIEQFEGVGADVRHLLHFAETFGESRTTAEGALQILKVWFRDLLAAKSGAMKLLNRDLADLAQRSARERSEVLLHRFSDLVERADQDISTRNGSPRLQLERMLIEMGQRG